MFIDLFAPNWPDWLDTKAADVAEGEHIYLLLDSVFVPGLQNIVRPALPAGHGPTLLFEALPGCNNEVRNVSPLVIRYAAANARLTRALKRCSGWPMVSAIVTSESLDELTRRLAPWCVVEIDDQRFNFRFPDTRRLAGIYNALTPHQRAQLAGPASSWHYIGRDGAWKSLQISRSDCPPAIDPHLSAEAFAVMVADSEADEVLTLLQDRGRPCAPHSKIYAQISEALRIANEARLEPSLRLDWCEACIDDATLIEVEKVAGWRTQILA